MEEEGVEVGHRVTDLLEEEEEEEEEGVEEETEQTISFKEGIT